MSSGPENTFIGSVHKLLPAELYRMKNHNQYNSGIADCWYSGVRDLWVEFKFIVVPKRGTTEIDLTSGPRPEISALQQNWLRSRHEEGRSVGVIVGSKNGGVWFPGTSWDQALTAGEFVLRLRSRKELAELISRLTG